MRHSLTRSVLSTARARLEHIGWTQEKYCRYAGNLRHPVAFCMLGAVHGGRPDDAALDVGSPVYDAISALEAVLPPNGGGVASYNDRHGRTLAEVLDTFDRALALTEAPADV